MVWTVLIPSTDEPFDLDMVKAHCRIDTDIDDALLEDIYIPAARSHLEYLTRYQFGTATLLYALDAFPPCGELVLPQPPLQSVTALKYYDGNNTLQTWASSNYYVDTVSQPGRVVLAPGSSWPQTSERPNAVQVTYMAGWATPEAMPRGLQQALLLLIAHFYENREDSVEKALSCLPWGVTQLAGMHRLMEV
jgi:uncharacterized phiE125 gp8 family phage protein